ncbi:MAG: glycosyltransferase involved in cell wall biosynthesis [Saprospiraceae bacterium]|jgi:glycosyltransferase involved in cell wall biosynthesis
MNISLVIPVYNEEESLPPLMTWISRVMKEHHFTYEVLFIDDGSSDKSWQVINYLSQEYQNIIRGIRFRRNYGKSAALKEGFKAAKGDVIITMDADLQDSPDEVPALYKMIAKDGYDLVSGWKQKRHDPISKTIPSKLFNAVARKVSGIPLHDFNCGLKAYANDAAKDINVYGDMHRWMPVLAKWQGYTKIGEKVVEHRAREYGVSKFGAKRLISGFLDLLSLFFVGKFNKQPMHFFGTWGLIFFGIGALILMYLTVSKMFYSVSGISDRPLFFFGMLTTIIGTQLFLTGFLAELTIDIRGKNYTYNISDTIGLEDPTN